MIKENHGLSEPPHWSFVESYRGWDIWRNNYADSDPNNDYQGSISSGAYPSVYGSSIAVVKTQIDALMPPVFASVYHHAEGLGSGYAEGIEAEPYPTDFSAARWDWVEGTNITFTAHPGTGWAFDHWVWNSTTITTPSFNVPSLTGSNNDLTCVFVEVSPNWSHVTITVHGAGAVNPPAGDYPNTYRTGQDLRIDYVSGDNYKGMWRNGIFITDHIMYIFVNIGTTEQFDIYFEAPPEMSSVNYSIFGQGHLTPEPSSNPFSTAKGSTISFQALPNNNTQYEFDYWIYKGNTYIDNPHNFTFTENTESFEVHFKSKGQNGNGGIPLTTIIGAGVGIAVVLGIIYYTMKRRRK